MAFNITFVLPQVLYIILVAGIWLAALALVSPGTGALEILSFIALVLVGVGTIWVPFNGWALLVIASGIASFVMSLRRKNEEAWLVAAVVGFVIGSVFLFRGSSRGAAVSPILAVPVSLMTIGYFWVAIRQVLIAHRAAPAMDLSSLVGAVGEARTDLDPHGTIFAQGELWTAETQTPVQAGDAVRIVGREKLILFVEPILEGKEE